MAQSRPPFSIPPGIKVTGSRWESRQLPEGVSDGLKSKWPVSPYRPSDPRVYQIKIAQDWAERDGSAHPDTMYYLPALPEGYACFEMDQPSGKQVYKRLFGHPSGRFYDSIVRFEPHVWWLLDGRKGLCECILCGHVKPTPGPPKPRKNIDIADRSIAIPRTTIKRDGPTSAPSHDSSSRSPVRRDPLMDRTRRPARGLAVANPVDEEGTRDVWKEVITRIYTARDSKRGIEDDIREESSVDWLSERDSIPQYFTKIEQQHSFVPRIGELVLWCPSFPENLFLQRDPASGRYQFYDIKESRFVDQHPSWRGGVITAAPSRASQNGPIDFTDLLNLPEKKTALNTSGFRVETIPDPNFTDKSLSKQYRYVPLRNVRPLSQWQLLLKGIPQQNLHPSVLYALTYMTSISLIDKWRINGDWADGSFISARGMFLGSELITIGDTIRLASDTTNALCTEVMVVDTIRLYLEGLKTQYLELGSKQICSSSMVTLLGKAYTIRDDCAYKRSNDSHSGSSPQPVSLENVKSIFRPVGTALYGIWYPLHDPHRRLEVSYDKVLGRLYEAEAVRLWSGQRQQQPTVKDNFIAEPDLAFDMSSIIAGRKYATKVDERIPGPPITDPNEIRWLISDYRAQSLDVASFNGLEVGPYFEARTPATLAAWRAHIKISNGEKVTQEELTSAMGPRVRERPMYRIPTLAEMESSSGGTPGGKRRGRQPGSKVIDGKVYRAGQHPSSPHQSPILKRSMLSTTTTTQDSTPEADFSDEHERTDEETLTIEIAETQPQYKHSSQMAGAALATTDSEDIADDSDPDLENFYDENDGATSRALRKAYGADEQTDEEEEGTVPDDDLHHYDDHGDGDSDIDDHVEDVDFNSQSYLSVWKQNTINKPRPTQAGPRPSKPPPLSKSQIFQSVEMGQASTLESIAAPVYDSDVTDEDAEFNIEDWKNPRNARGGTEESSGGDYTDADE